MCFCTINFELSGQRIILAFIQAQEGKRSRSTAHLDLLSNV